MRRGRGRVGAVHEHGGDSSAEVDLVDLVGEREIESAEDLDHPPQPRVECFHQRGLGLRPPRRPPDLVRARVRVRGRVRVRVKG